MAEERPSCRIYACFPDAEELVLHQQNTFMPVYDTIAVNLRGISREEEQPITG